jgi:hypothetical protein
MRFYYAEPTIERNSSTIAAALYGFTTKQVFDGSSAGWSLARYDEDFYRWPPVAHGMGQFQPVHASGHVDVREQQSDVRTRFQQGYSFVSIAGLKRNEASFLDDFDGEHPQ